MSSKLSRNQSRIRRHARVRKKISGTPECPRMDVFRSNAHIEVQIIDDVAGNTLVSASSVQMKLENGGNIEAAQKVGRGGFVYTGRVKALAEAAREAGLEF